MRVWSKQARYLQIREGGNLIHFKLQNILRNPTVVNIYLFDRMFFRTLVFFSLITSTCKGLVFKVSRGAPNASTLDIFSNLDPSAKCPNQRPNLDAGKSWCRARNAYCSAQGCCMCKCQYSSATFKMKVDPHQATCVRNSDIRSFAGTFITFILVYLSLISQ